VQNSNQASQKRGAKDFPQAASPSLFLPLTPGAEEAVEGLRRMTDESEERLPEETREHQTADAIIGDCAGNPRAAVIELLAIIESLIAENKKLREAASPGFARRRPMVFGSPK
jgi:hypothetical protein